MRSFAHGRRPKQMKRILPSGGNEAGGVGRGVEWGEREAGGPCNASLFMTDCSLAAIRPSLGIQACMLPESGLIVLRPALQYATLRTPNSASDCRPVQPVCVL